MTRLRLRPGRSLSWSPTWAGDAQIVFDRGSGDFWVLDPVASDLLRRLTLAPDDAAAMGRGPADASIDSPDSEPIAALVERLIAERLLERVDGDAAAGSAAPAGAAAPAGRSLGEPVDPVFRPGSLPLD